MEPIRILFLAANPLNSARLRLDEEVREIEAKIRTADYRDSLQLVSKWAVRPDDLLQYLNQYRPHIVHFSGHADCAEELILEDSNGQANPVSKEALVSLFTTLKDNIRVVVLNACYSRPQAEAITEQIDCAIGMRKAIGDGSAIAFAASFYRAIGFGRSVRAAFDQGKVALQMEGNAEDRTPQLHTRAGLDPATVVLINSPPAISPQEAAGEATTQWPRVDRATAGEFLAALERSPLAVFFDVRTGRGDKHTDFLNWFDEQMQVHLALQDSTARFSQLRCVRALLECTPGHESRKCPPYLGSPAIRVIFVEETRRAFATALNAAFQTGKGKYGQLPPLIMIHQMMGCPLAVVCLDELAKIFEEQIKSATDTGCGSECQRWVRGLGFHDFDPHDLLAGDATKATARDRLRADLIKMRSPGQDVRRAIRPSIDFAMLMNHKSQEFTDTWGVVLLDIEAPGEDQEKLLYYEIPSELGNTPTWKIRDLTIPVEVSPGFKDDLLRFGILVWKEVFTPHKPDRLHSWITDYNPAMRTLDVVDDALENAVLYVVPQFEPLAIANEYSANG